MNDRPGVWSHSEIVRPESVEVVDGRYLLAGEPFSTLGDFSVAGAFDDFTEILDGSDTAAAARSFVLRYGWPNLCRHGLPDRHDAAGCDVLMLDDRPALDVVALRRAAEALWSADDLARRVRRRQAWSAEPYKAVQRWPQSVGFLRNRTDPVQQRAYLAHWMTRAMQQCDVRPLVTWAGHKRPEVTYEVDGLLGLLVVEAVRRIAQERTERSYSCAVCGSPVWPNRAPKPGEQTYCSQASCQRERQRLNQAARRARAKESAR